MKRSLLLFAIAVILILTPLQVRRFIRPVGAQAISNQPVLRWTPNALSAWMPVETYDCGVGLACVRPTSAPAFITGITVGSGAAGTYVPVLMVSGGLAECTFATQPVLLDVVTGGNGVCVDTGSQSSAGVPNTVDVLGRITQVMDSTHAYVTLRIAHGDLIQTSTIQNFTAAVQAAQTPAPVTSVNGATGAVTVPTYTNAQAAAAAPVQSVNGATGAVTVAVPVQSVNGQTGAVSLTIPPAQVQSDWNSSTAPSAILNKPTIPAAQVNSDWNATSGVAQILNKPALATVATTGAYSSLTGTPAIPTSYTLYGTGCTLAASCAPNLPVTALPAFTGDATTVAGASAFTLASIGSAGNCGSSTSSCTLTFDGKGRETARADTPISFPTAVTAVTGTSPVVSSGGTTPAISCPTCVTTASTVTAGTATALSGTTAPTISNSGTSTAAVINIGIPKEAVAKTTAVLTTTGTVLGIGGCSTATTVTLTGLTSGMSVAAYPLTNPVTSGNPGLIQTTAFYSAANTATVQVCNTSSLLSLTMSGATYAIVAYNP